MKWEYKVHKEVTVMQTSLLDQYGNDGWELAGINTSDSCNYAYYYFKRPIEEPMPLAIMD